MTKYYFSNLGGTQMFAPHAGEVPNYNSGFESDHDFMQRQGRFPRMETTQESGVAFSKQPVSQKAKPVLPKKEPEISRAENEGMPVPPAEKSQ